MKMTLKPNKTKMTQHKTLIVSNNEKRIESCYPD